MSYINCQIAKHVSIACKHVKVKDLPVLWNMPFFLINLATKLPLPPILRRIRALPDVRLCCRGSLRRCSPGSRWPPGCRRAPAAAPQCPAGWRTGPRATSPRSWAPRSWTTESGWRGNCHCPCRSNTSTSRVRALSFMLHHGELVLAY